MGVCELRERTAVPKPVCALLSLSNMDLQERYKWLEAGTEKQVTTARNRENSLCSQNLLNLHNEDSDLVLRISLGKEQNRTEKSCK